MSASFEIAANGESVSLDAFIEALGKTFIDVTITVTDVLEDGEYTRTIALDLDHLMLSKGYDSFSYAAFDGAIQLKVA